MPEYLQSDINGKIINKWYSVDPSRVEGKPNILQVTREVFKALTKFHKVENGQVREMTQAEKDALLAEEAQAIIDTENTKISNLDDLIQSADLQGMTLAKIDTAIDNIGSLADAKTFLKKLCRYIVKFVSRSV